MCGVTDGNYWQEIVLQKRINGRKRRRLKQDLDVNKTVNCLILEEKYRKNQAEDIEDFLVQMSHILLGTIYCASLINIKAVIFKHISYKC
jgi:hypothetical protein